MSRYTTYNPLRKITAGPTAKPTGPGTTPAINVRQSYTGTKLPGPASNAFAAMKRGAREVNGYAAYAGLSKSGQHWIQGAIKHPGALTKKAKKEGDSPMEYAREHMHDSGKTGQQARLAMTLGKMRKK